MDDKEKFENYEDEKRKKTLFLLILYILSIIAFILSGSFTLSAILKTRNLNYTEVEVGQIKMELVNNDDTNIKLTNAHPISYTESLKLNPFEFKVKNEGTLPVMYRLKLQDAENKESIIKELIEKNLDELPEDIIRYSLIDADNNEIIKTGIIDDLNEGIIITEKLLPAYSRAFEFRLWLDENASNEYQNKYYVGEIILEIDEILD